MSTGKRLLGKIFISYSSADKAFVRRLARRIKQERFDVWLEEHAMIVGDPLAEKIADGVTKARVVLVVVSKASVKSRWLRYELNLATQRMVKGKCRVIPLVISDVDLPAEVEGLLYADFRQPRSRGMRSILTALEYEAHQATQRAGFWAQAETLISKAFGGRGWVSRLGDFDHETYETVSVGVVGADDATVVYNVVSDYGHQQKPIDDGFWSEYEHANDDKEEDLFLVFSERPVKIPSAAEYAKNSRVTYRKIRKSISNHEVGYVVFADVSGFTEGAERKRVVRDARELLTDLASQIARNPAMTRIDWKALERAAKQRRRKRKR